MFEQAFLSRFIIILTCLCIRPFLCHHACAAWCHQEKKNSKGKEAKDKTAQKKDW